MNNYGFLSGLGDQMGEFIDFKHNMGHPYERGVSYLKDFDRFCVDNFTGTTCLDKEMCLSWAQIRPSEINSGFISRITPLRQLGKFLNSIGIQAYVLPDSFHGHVPRYLPHIFTEEELKSFFAAADSLTPYYQSVARHLVAPVLFRLMYCCGLRPFETRLLENDDVNLDTGRTFINQSKGHKDRIVMIPPDLLETCRTYRMRVKNLFPDSKLFFPNHHGDAHSANQLRYLFELCWAKAGIKAFELPKPRVYDFRYPHLNKLRTFPREHNNNGMFQEKGSDKNHFFIGRTPQSEDRPPSVPRHFLGADLSFSSSSVANAFASCSVVMSK